MNEYIVNDNGDTIGYYTALEKSLREEVQNNLAEKNYEMAETNIGILQDLQVYQYEKELLVIKTNNGMGYSVDTYKNYEEI